MNLEIYTPAILIVLGVVSGLAVIVALIQTCAWFSRAGKEIIDLPTLGKLLLHILGTVSTVIFLVIAGVSVWWLILFKIQYNGIFESNTSTPQSTFKMLLIVSFILKTGDILHIIIRQSTIDIFFIDWEKSKSGTANTVSAWRTCFVANEFNGIQTFRRIHVAFHLLFTLFFLKVINLENIASIDSRFANASLPISPNYTMEYESIFRSGTGFLVLSGTVLIQYFFYVLIYQRLVEDKIINFVDLCSVSNISIFILDQNRHGYYIHGRSAHGIADVNIKDMIMNLERESRLMSIGRGLEANSPEQLFIMKINRTFRSQYDLLFQKYGDYVRQRRARGDKEHFADILLQSYQNLNKFLCAFIGHALPTHQYVIRNRYFLEKVFNFEFPVALGPDLTDTIDNFFFVDDENVFTKILFYGQEKSLIIWNMITFLCVDFVFSNYILATIITFIFDAIAVGLRNSLGRRNLSTKALVPRELLI
ncbi:unnamed protein product [Rotaria socialis]|uniref:Meckelin n=1 Tax=Rotaria socialis TaxID=392032 RepID=A0A818EVY6_9BILA|nr:unnamed protein product [Rotaria socialis]CAF3464391.1 unnamed protein product [Rotaria socialis]CAF4105169.1 unnamed protein product [Rotaria socialis]CAF4557970.1 unnamed protein product [Rotaria socialis]